MLELKIQTNYKILKVFLNNLESVFKHNLNEFRISNEFTTKWKTVDSKSMPSYWIIKIFAIVEEFLKSIIKIKKNNKNTKRKLAPLKFSSPQKLFESSSNYIEKDEFDIIDDSLKNNLYFMWKAHISPNYKERNLIAHESYETHKSPSRFLNMFFLLILFCFKYVEKSALDLLVKKEKEKKTLTFSIDKEIIDEGMIDWKILKNFGFFYKPK